MCISHIMINKIINLLNLELEEQTNSLDFQVVLDGSDLVCMVPVDIGKLERVINHHIQRVVKRIRIGTLIDTLVGKSRDFVPGESSI